MCNKKFVDGAKRFGYEILFKPHPKYANFSDCFEADEYVKMIGYNESYQLLFAESSLLITDFSSTVFDFAYLQKPVIYYWFTDNPHKESYFNYETMGFGEIIKDQDKLINSIVEYMENGCIMDNKYKQRAITFFAYNDKNNSQRVYNEAIII